MTISVIASAVGITAIVSAILGVKHYNDKKLLESALTFLNSNPVIVVSQGDCEGFDDVIDQFTNYLTLFKEGKTDELKKKKIEIEVGGGSIIVKTSLNVSNSFNHFRLKLEDFIATESRYCG